MSSAKSVVSETSSAQAESSPSVYQSFSSYHSCNSLGGDVPKPKSPTSTSSLYKSCLETAKPKPKSLSWRKSMRALARVVPSQQKSKVVPPKLKKYVILNGSSLDLIHSGPGDSLVAVYGKELPLTENENAFNCNELRRPIYIFIKTVNWKHATRVLMSDITNDGVYLVGMFWKLKRPFKLTNGQSFNVTEPVILHCICKEPMKRFQGRIGPLSTFVPHRAENNKQIGGIWVSLFSDQIYAEFIYQLTPFNPEYREKLKAVDQKMDQVMFFVANEGACVGIQIMNTKREEKQIRQSKRVYHHERPLILQDGFYLVEGKFETTFLNGEQATNKLNLDCSSSPKIVIIGEGTHLIRTQTEPALEWVRKKAKPSSDLSATKCDQLGNKSLVKSVSTNGVSKASLNKPKSNSPVSCSLVSTDRLKCAQINKIRQVEVCLDCRYERVIALDHSVLKQDFDFKFDSN